MSNRPIAAQRCVAIVLAGDRHPGDPVAMDAGVSCKAIAPVKGRAMVLRVLDALEASGVVEAIILCGPPAASLKDCPELEQRLEHEGITWIPNLDSPSRSVEAALEQIDEHQRVLLTTADHALLQGEIVEYFVRQSLQSGADATVALAAYATVHNAYPAVRRTVLKLGNGGYCSCNLFAFNTAVGRKLVPFWREVEQRRKRPARMIAGILGIRGVFLYLLGRLSLDQALKKVSQRLQLEVRPVLMPYARAAVDVDTARDRQFVEDLLGQSEN